jgi:DNA repair exonuclease SbcCD ATPase subunit
VISQPSERLTPGESLILESQAQILDAVREDRRHSRKHAERQNAEAAKLRRRMNLAERAHAHLAGEVAQIREDLRQTRIELAMAVHSR